MKVWVVIPAYNEAERLGLLLDELRQKNLSTLVVDDGSSDHTYRVAQVKADAALRNEKNLGKGLALNRAISYLFTQQDFDYVLIMDADGQHSPADIDAFLEAAAAGSSFVVGNRMIKHCGMPWIRVVTNRLMSLLISKITGQYIPDSQCGFRMIKREVLERIHIKTKKFEIESEILIKAARLGFPIQNIPIQSIYFKNRQSKIRPFRDAFRFIQFILKAQK